jgi:DNA-binding transcriptional LysR family regulator
MTMNDRQLRYFIAVAEELSFSRAAWRLNVSQPPLSMQIKALEQELGAALLTRTRRSVALTQAGRLFLENARKAVMQMDYAGELVRQAGRGEAGVLRIGFTGSVPMLDIFARIMRAFRNSYPKVRVELRHLSTGSQFKAFDEDQLDVGILRPSLHLKSRPGIELHELWKDRLMAFCPEGHRLSHTKQPLDISEFASEDFVTVSRHIGCGVHDQTMALCAAAGFAPRVVQEGGELSTVLGLVAAGIGVSILPECYTRIGLPGVMSRPLMSPGTESRFLLAVRLRHTSKVPARFLDVAQSILAERLNKAA